jgi:tetratricopeptide (TPR) repeat protein
MNNLNNMRAGLCVCAIAGFLASWPAATMPEPEAGTKASAHELYQNGRLTEAMEEFGRYLERNPGDLSAALQLAAWFGEAGDHAEAARLLEHVHQRLPGNQPAHFNLAVALLNLNRAPEAQAIFKQLQRSGNRDIATAATEALLCMEADSERKARAESEQHVFELAAEFRHEEVIAKVSEMELGRPPSFPMEMQRLYSMHSLGRYAPALERANWLAGAYPKEPGLILLRADLLLQTGRRSEAAELWRKLEEGNPGSAEAAQARRQLEAARGKESSEKLFELAARREHRELINAITELEQREQLSFVLELQRLYAWQALGENDTGLKRSNDLAERHPKSPELGLLRAHFLAEHGRKEEALGILTQIQSENAGGEIARVAAERSESLLKATLDPPKEITEDEVYALANQRQHRAVIAAVDKLEQRQELSVHLAMQRLYALQDLGETTMAIQRATELANAHPASQQIAMLRADLLARDHQWLEAAKVLKRLKNDHPQTPAAEEAERRLQNLPPVANLDKWFWGESYLSGDYLGRFGTVVGSGFVRHGFYIPGARWIQPYAELRFAADTRSGLGGQRSVIADNHLVFHGGVRAQPFATEYFFFYAQAGIDKDLLDRRSSGSWQYDSQAGLYGFKSWGPGTVLLSAAPGPPVTTAATVPPLTSLESEELPSLHEQSMNFLWRGDWFLDAGADFSYYHRHRSWIGYGQAHQGLRLFQLGPRTALDAYLVENLSWDVRGNYFDNLFEAGPGARLIIVVRRGWELVARAEWINGFYMGRDSLETRGGAKSTYDDFRAGLSVGARW